MASHGLGGRRVGLALFLASPSALRPRGSMVFITLIIPLHPNSLFLYITAYLRSYAPMYYIYAYLYLLLTVICGRSAQDGFTRQQSCETSCKQVTETVTLPYVSIPFSDRIYVSYESYYRLSVVLHPLSHHPPIPIPFATATYRNRGGPPGG